VTPSVGPVARRSLAQRGLVTAVLAVVLAGAVVLGTCTLLITTGQDRARSAHLRATPAAQLTAEVVVGRVPPDAAGAADAAAAALTSALAPLPTSLSTWATSTVRPLDAGDGVEERLGYLAGISDLPDHAELLTGRWPEAATAGRPWEAVLPRQAADLLGVGPGDELQLDHGEGPTAPGVTVVLVGTFAADVADPAWRRDLLGGTGYDPALEFGAYRRTTRPAFGPLVVAADTLLGRGAATGTGSGLDQVQVVASPDVAHGSSADLNAAGRGMTGLRTTLPDALTGPDAAARFDAPLARTLAGARTQQAVTGSGVLVVALVGLALAGTALGLAARLVTGRRTGESVLLTARGAGRGQLAGRAAAEAAALAAVTTVVAVPGSLLLFRALTAVPRLSAAGLGGPVGVTWPLVAAVGLGAVGLTAVLVLPALLPVHGGAAVRRGRRSLVVRSGVDLLLAGLAVVVFLQLRAHPGSSDGAVDPLLVAAPVLVLVAGAVLALRALPLLQLVAERRATRARGLVGPLAAWEVARRPHATGAALLLVLATAAATFGTGYASTWDTSQADQAAARVGTDVVVPASVPARPGEGAQVAAVLGGTVSPATVRPVALGNLSATGTALPENQLVAVDTSVAGDLLAGAPPGAGDWTALTAVLGAPDRSQGVVLHVPDTGPALTVTGSTAAAAVGVTPVLVVQDARGARATLTGQQVPLDGAPHSVELRDATDTAPVAGTDLTVVGADLTLTSLDPGGIDPEVATTTAVSVALQLPAGSTGPAVRWSAGALLDAEPGVLTGTSAALTPGAAGATLDVGGQISLPSLSFGPLQLLVTAYQPPLVVPVLLTPDLATAISARPGDPVALVVGNETVSGQVAGLTPWLPGAPDASGVLADGEVLARTLAAFGHLEPVADSWWAGGVADPGTGVAGLAGVGLPGAVTRDGVAAQLRDGPLHVGLPAVLWLLTATAVGLALTGTALHTAAGLGSRSVEVARLQGMGVPRRVVAAAVLVEHALVTSVSVALGAVVGALATRELAPLMTVSETGRVPVPAPVAQWPWPAESVLVVGLLLGCAAVVVPVAAVLVRRAGSAHLRLGDAT